MAFTSDVEQALADLATAALYPNGVVSPSQVSPATGYLVHISRGWPTPDELDQTLAAGQVLVTVYPQQTHSRIVDGYLEHGYVVPGVPVTLTVAVTGSTVTLGGTVTPGHLVGVLADGQPYAYKVAPGDTLDSIADALAALLNATSGFLVSDFGEGLTDDSGASLAAADFATVSQGPPVTISIASNRPVLARSVGNGTAVKEYRWQEEVYRIITWAPSAEARDAVTNAINVAMAQVQFLALPNSPAARVLWSSSERTDTAMKADLYRADLCFTVRYATTSAKQVAALLWGDLEIEKQTWSGTPIVIRKNIF